MIFIYKARNKEGLLIAGELEGDSVGVVKNALASQDLFPVSVQPKGFEQTFRGLLQFKVKTKELINLTRQIHIMFSAGLPMDRILLTAKRQAKHKGLQEAMDKIHHDVSAGLKLSDAFSKHPKYFNKLYTSLLGVGESAGVLETTLKEIIKILEKENTIRAKVKSATLYPKIVLGALVGVAVLMLTMVIPVFGDFYAGFGAELPLPTRILIGLSDFIVAYWYVALGLVVAAVFAWKTFLKTPYGRDWASMMQFRIPIFGPLNLMVANSRFGHLIGSLYRSGLPLSNSLEIVADTMDNYRYREDVMAVKEGLSRGESLSAAMASERYFTPLMIENTEVGEMTGRLDELLAAVAIFYDEEVDDILKNLTTLIEPILLFFIFGMVTLLALSVFLPVWNLSKVIMPS